MTRFKYNGIHATAGNVYIGQVFETENRNVTTTQQKTTRWVCVTEMGDHFYGPTRVAAVRLAQKCG